MKNGLWGVDVKRRRAEIWSGAEAKISTTTVERSGQGIAVPLGLPDAELARYKNKSFAIPRLSCRSGISSRQLSGPRERRMRTGTSWRKRLRRLFERLSLRYERVMGMRSGIDFSCCFSRVFEGRTMRTKWLTCENMAYQRRTSTMLLRGPLMKCKYYNVGRIGVNQYSVVQLNCIPVG